MSSSVLMIDWDLEAPGLDRYFLSADAQRNAKVTSHQPSDQTGLMGLLHDAFVHKAAQLDQRQWQQRLIALEVPRAESTAVTQTPLRHGRLDLLAAGHGSADYSDRLTEFSWPAFFSEARGAEWLEALRDQWAASYNFVLIDSRTGLSDSGGVCTVQMPHILIFVFTANDQSFADGLRVIEAIQEERTNFGHDRPALGIVPLLSRWEGRRRSRLARSGCAVSTQVWLP